MLLMARTENCNNAHSDKDNLALTHPNSLRNSVKVLSSEQDLEIPLKQVSQERMCHHTTQQSEQFNFNTLLKYSGWGGATILALCFLVGPLLHYGGAIVATILALGVVMLILIGAITELLKTLK